MRRPRLRHLATTLALALPIVGSRASAQQADSTRPAQTTSDGSGVSTLRVGAAIVAAGVAIAPFDVAITRRLQSADLQNSASWRAGAVLFDAYGAPGSMIAGPLLAVAGSVTRNPTMSEIGIHVSESYATAAAAVFVLKGIAGRTRPYAIISQNAYDFALGRGFPHRESYSSFPSGHATGSFAFASSISAEAAHHWPRHALLVGTLAYSGAFLDGVSRVYRDRHWPSDIAAGALVGTVSGLLVTRHQHAHPGNRLDALARRMLFAPAADGHVLVGLSQPF